MSDRCSSLEVESVFRWFSCACECVSWLQPSVLACGVVSQEHHAHKTHNPQRSALLALLLFAPAGTVVGVPSLALGHFVGGSDRDFRRGGYGPARAVRRPMVPATAPDSPGWPCWNSSKPSFWDTPVTTPCGGPVGPPQAPGSFRARVRTYPVRSQWMGIIGSVDRFGLADRWWVVRLPGFGCFCL